MRFSIACFALGMIVAGCSTIPVDSPKSVLASQILNPQPGHKGLVNAHCTHDQKTGVCAWSYDEYDLSIAAVRQELLDLKFVCNVNGQIFIPSENDPGIERNTYTQKCFLFFCDKPVAQRLDFIAASEIQRMINAHTVCFSLKSYPIQSQFKPGPQD